MPTSRKTAYVVGQRPPVTLTAKAREQLANAKPSKKVAELAEIVAKHLSISSTGTKRIIFPGVNSLPPGNSTSGLTALEAATAARKPATKSRPRKYIAKAK
jgi:hypothetical protein